MTFDPEIHQLKIVIIKCGQELRRAKGEPEENNISVLYEEASAILGIPTIPTTSAEADRMPSAEISPPILTCPQCGRVAQLFSLCVSCKDAENGKFKTKLVCQECKYEEKSEKPMVIWLQEMGIDFGNQSKESLGIKTITDDGIK